MTRVSRLSAFVFAAVVTALLAGPAPGQPADIRPGELSSRSALPPNVIVPQSRAFAEPGREATLSITGVEVGVVIVEQVATTTMEISLGNGSSRAEEAVMVVPVPDGAVVRHFDFEGAGAEPSASLLSHAEASSTYRGIVSRMRDPALLEFVGTTAVRSSVFPVPAGGEQKVRLTYEHVIDGDGRRIDYVLPRTESLQYRVPWQIHVRIKSHREIAAVYSPSHPLQTERGGDGQIRVSVAESAATEPGAFRLSYLFGDEGMNATVFTYPDASIGGGYFLLLAGLVADADGSERPQLRREVTLVLDRSGSMDGEKMIQARSAALQVLESLEPGEAFNVLDFSNNVGRFADQPVVKDEHTMASVREYLSTVSAGGGTNIHDALAGALRQHPTEGTLPLVLFLTDGLPTVGETGEMAIRRLGTQANPHNRRIFSFGVGADVNTPLLDKIGEETRATSTYVLPGEDVGVKVASVFSQLAGPMMADLEVAAVDADGNGTPARVRDMLPARLPDLYEGDQLVLLGQYLGEAPVRLQISGNLLGTPGAFAVQVNPERASVRNAFVPRLWASRRIADLVDAIREMGADSEAAQLQLQRNVNGVGRHAADLDDPRLRELVGEVVRLSTEFGVLTEYTAFLATEGSNLSTPDAVMAEAMRNFRDRAINTRCGIAGANQSMNWNDQRVQEQTNRRNGYWDANMNRVEVTGVQQVNDRAFFRRDGTWVDSRLLNEDGTQADTHADRVVAIGSSEYDALVEALADAGRNGCVALSGDILLSVGDERVLVTAEPADASDGAGDAGDAGEADNEAPADES